MVDDQCDFSLNNLMILVVGLINAKNASRCLPASHPLASLLSTSPPPHTLFCLDCLLFLSYLFSSEKPTKNSFLKTWIFFLFYFYSCLSHCCCPFWAWDSISVPKPLLFLRTTKMPNSLILTLSRDGLTDEIGEEVGWALKNIELAYR